MENMHTDIRVKRVTGNAHFNYEQVNEAIDFRLRIDTPTILMRGVHSLFYLTL